MLFFRLVEVINFFFFPLCSFYKGKQKKKNAGNLRQKRFPFWIRELEDVRIVIHRGFSVNFCKFCAVEENTKKA